MQSATRTTALAIGGNGERSVRLVSGDTAGAQTSLSVIDAFDRAAVDDVRTGRPLNGRVNPRRS